MTKVEYGEQKFCDLCATKTKEGKIIGGQFCVKLSGISNTREIFREEKFSANGSIKFWSCQRQEDIKDCEQIKASLGKAFLLELGLHEEI